MTARLLSPDQFSFLTESVMATEAVNAALELGILRRLEAGPVSPETMAEQCGIDQRHARLLLAVLVGLGIAQPDNNGVYRAGATGFSQIAPSLIASGRLTESLRNRAPRLAADTKDGAQALYPNLLPYLAAALQPAAERAAALLGGSGMRIVDLGAGSAPWSVALASINSEVHVTAVDLPNVVPITQASVSETGLSGQFECTAGDIFQIDLGEEVFDLAIAGGICHLFDEEHNRLLLEKVFRALAPEGRLAIIDVLPNERLDGPLQVLLYALGLISRTRGGSVYPFSTYVEWLRGTGFSKIERTELSERPAASLITATRPSASDV